MFSLFMPLALTGSFEKTFGINVKLFKLTRCDLRHTLKKFFMKISLIEKSIFKYRGIFPIPFYILCLIFSNWNRNAFITGFILIIVGLILRFWSVGYLGKSSRETHFPDAKTLIVSGPYRYTRNPIYIGNILIYLGFTVLSNVFLPYFPLLTAMFFGFLYSLIVRFEEKYLEKKFATTYQLYRQKVHRWFPLRIYQTQTGYPFQFRRALSSEKTTWITFALSLGILLTRIVYI